jgi:hypothetical protein
MQGMKAYFGYGSLVNPATRLSVPGEMRVALKGWRRQWRLAADTPMGRVCGLSVGRDPGSVIEGLLVPVEPDEEAVIDARETGYDRVPLSVGDFDFLDTKPGDPPINLTEAWLYEADRESRAWASTENRILRSYLDVVLQGYMRMFGVEAMERFLRTTDGLVPEAILEDRSAPLYPRAVSLSEEERALIDAALSNFG